MSPAVSGGHSSWEGRPSLALVDFLHAVVPWSEVFDSGVVGALSVGRAHTSEKWLSIPGSSVPPTLGLLRQRL